MNRRDIFKIILIALALFLFVRLTDRIGRSQNAAESEFVRKAVAEMLVFRQVGDQTRSAKQGQKYIYTTIKIEKLCYVCYKWP